MKLRLDKLLVQRELVATRSKAKILIEKSLVECDGKIILKAGENISLDAQINILTTDFYVSRSAYKMVEALEIFKPNIDKKTAADVGASTGGFTEVLLKNGVEKVYCIDVGHGQLDKKLKKDSRVINIEGVNIKHAYNIEEKVDFAVTDLSYISLTKVFHNIWSLVKESGFVIALIKPQFEAGKDRLGKDAVIRDDKLRIEILNEVLTWFTKEGYEFDTVIDSPIKGKDGNSEYLIKIHNRKQD
ncbi:MAG: 23S rRNA (cytidine1920-2'-O)/16S rRNA (cytidine1409-2'-O)-methyltransferase [Thermoproteota archaeon]|jgi:23S rRNA (cytidine1920-2'-O)/16S rRNA (cytidine1409-2'-O)-methyltransferase